MPHALPLPSAAAPTLSKLPDHLGDERYAKKRDEIRRRLASQLPKDAVLPQTLLDDLPLDVTDIPASCGLLSPSELALTDLDATAVRDQVAAGKLTAVEAVTAFGRRAAIAEQLTSCLTDFFLDDGIEQAQALDEHYARTGKVVGPLHGVPISIKDHMPIKGRWESAGFLSTVRISQSDCDMVRILRDLGAVFYVKTNQPQAIMHLEAQSTMGRTLNPYNLGLTAGGSSGGEGALNALRGSCLGVGTDIGGSIRNPAANNGIYGMRPSCHTMPMEGYKFYMDGFDSIVCSTGPMCRSARDIDLFIAAVRNTQPHLLDPSLFPLPWKPVTLPDDRPLRVGIMQHDGVVLPQPPMLRGMSWAKERLSNIEGIELVDFEPFQHDRALEIILSLYFEDGGDEIKSLAAASGEGVHPLTSFMLDKPICKRNTMEESWALRKAKTDYRREYARRWEEAGIDVLLCPPFTGTANPHDTTKYWGYTAQWNLLDYPGIVFPTGLQADPAVDTKPTRTSFFSDEDRFNDDLYIPEQYTNAPISLQLIARRFDDSKLMSAMVRIEEALGL